MIDTPPLDRVLIIAPHPDDDVIAAGGLIQRCLAAGGELRVVFVTGGESNDWPQRAMLRKWRITAADRARWAKMRCTEAECALTSIGARSQSAFFLDYPDQQLSTLARAGDTRLRDDLAAHVAEFRPTVVIAPSAFDMHTDHRALSYFAHAAIRKRVLIATYVVHGKPPALRTLFTIHLTEEEQQRKRAAIGCHESQLLLSRERFLSYARAIEIFYSDEYDVVRVHSALSERIATVRHAIRAVVGTRKP